MIPKELTFLVFFRLFFFATGKKAGLRAPPCFHMILIEFISIIFFIRKSGTMDPKILVKSSEI